MTDNEFWAITPYNLGIRVKVFAERREIERDNQLTALWNAEALARSKRMPPLSSLLKRAATTKNKGIDEVDITTRLKAYQEGRKKNG